MLRSEHNVEINDTLMKSNPRNNGIGTNATGIMCQDYKPSTMLHPDQSRWQMLPPTRKSRELSFGLELTLSKWQIMNEFHCHLKNSPIQPKY
jgi:hypothetical protein